MTTTAGRSADDGAALGPERTPAEILGLAARDLLAADRADLARHVAAMALAADPDCGNCHSVMAGVLEACGAFDAALGHWRQAARLMPNAPQQRLNLALALLGRGDWAEGLAQYEARMAKEDWVPLASRPSIAAHRGRMLQPDERLQGRRVVVFTEQGLGDAILFARYVPMLAERGADVVLVCNPALRPLFEALAKAPAPGGGGGISLLSPPPDQPHGKINLDAIAFDAVTPLMSLARFFATRPDSVPAAGITLPRDPARVRRWRARLQGMRPGKPLVAIVHAANPLSASAAARSIPQAMLGRLLDVAEVAWVNLQGGDAGRRLAAAWPGLLDPLGADHLRADHLRADHLRADHLRADHLRADHRGADPQGAESSRENHPTDIEADAAADTGADTVPLDVFADILAAVDLLVTVDTMAAHCADAIGQTAWIAVPFLASWYWVSPDAAANLLPKPMPGEHTVWHRSARLFRQSARGDWTAPLDAIAAGLRDRFAG